MATSDMQRKVAEYHSEMTASGHHGGHDMYMFHFQWHQTNLDPRRPSQPDPNWGTNLVFGSNFLQMHHEMVKARDDEPKLHMMHSSIAAWFATKGYALPNEWSPTSPIPNSLGYSPDPSVFPQTIRSLLADQARQLGVTVEDLLTRNTNNPRFTLPGWATRSGIAAGEAAEPVTGARKLADFANVNQLGCCIVYPHNSWHGSIGGAMSSTATAIADPIFYFGVHWQIDKVFDEFKLILSERAIRGHDVQSLTAESVPSPARQRKVAKAFTDEQLRQFELERIRSAAIRSLPTATHTEKSKATVSVLESLAPAKRGKPSKKRGASTKVAALRGVQELMAVPAAKHDKAWLLDALQNAIQLEFSTIPPYLCAWWSVVNPADPVASMLKQIVIDEMMHLGSGANLLNAIGGAPQVNSAAVVPTYPGEMPGGVHPGMTIQLQGLTPDAIVTFMEIEKPDFAPVVTALHAGEIYATIGSFYNAIEAAFGSLQPSDITGDRQLTYGQITPVTDIPSAVATIKKIREQGEGTQIVPTSGSRLAHYYRFGEVHHGKKAVMTSSGWKYTGANVNFPTVYPMAAVPAGGYAVSLDFDKLFSKMLGNLQLAFANGDSAPLSDAVDDMRDMTDIARQLMQTPLPQGGGNYGPSFIFVP